MRHFPDRLSEDSRTATGQEGRERQGGWVERGVYSHRWTVSKESKHTWPLQLSMHTFYTCKPPYPTADHLLPPIHLFMETLQWQAIQDMMPLHVFLCTIFLRWYTLRWFLKSALTAPVFTLGLGFIEDNGRAVRGLQAPRSISPLSYRLPIAPFYKSHKTTADLLKSIYLTWTGD